MNLSTVSLGTSAPNFYLQDVVNRETVSLQTFKDKKALLIMFICRHCPFVKHVQNEISQIGKDFENKSLGIVAISSNDPIAYPEDSLESLKEQAVEAGFVFPYCFDETQETAQVYSASCTPDFFLFNSERKLVYRGQLDDSRPGNNIPVSGKDLREAINAVLEDKPVGTNQKPSMGCSIKWKVENKNFLNR